MNDRPRRRRAILVIAGVLVLAFVTGALFLVFGGLLTVRAEDPAQTYYIRSKLDFIDYSTAYAAGGRNPKDVLNISITGGDIVSGDGFISLGTSSRPFAGTIQIPASGTDTFHLFDCPLFDYISTDTKITGVVKIVREQANDTPAAGVLTHGSLFANHVVKGDNASASWNVELYPVSGEEMPSVSFESLIGDIADDCNVTVGFTNNTSLNVSSSSDAGYICGNLGSGATLTATLSGSASNVTVSSSDGDAGGMVGEMQPGSVLNLKNNTYPVKGVTSSNGYAGGLVGKCNDATVDTAQYTGDITVDGPVSGKKSAGGVFGYYKSVEAAETFTLADSYNTTAGMSVSSTDEYAGGIFGVLETAIESGAQTFSFNGNASGPETVNVGVTGKKGAGGICGGYKTNRLKNTLTVTNTRTTVSASGVSSGGLIGKVVDDETGAEAAYISISGVTSQSASQPAGGLIGNLGSKAPFVDVSGSVTVTGTFDAGVIGDAQTGVLRMQGVLDLSGYTAINADSAFIVKNRDRALIYALGDGKGTNGSWTFKRNVTQSIDDVHSWGEVIRTDGVILKEGDLFTVDMTEHTVTVKEAHTTIDNVTKFAKTALNMKLNTGDGFGALLFTSGDANLASTLNAATLNIGADIDLAGTGLTGFQRDDGYLKNWSGTSNTAKFTGTLNGNNHAITLATGENYGLQGNGTALDATSKQGNIHQHLYNGLFARTGGTASVNNLTVSGTAMLEQRIGGMNFGGVTACATQGLTLSHVTSTVGIRHRARGNYTAHIGGAIGIAQDNNLDVSITDCSFTPTYTDTSDEGNAAGNISTYVGGAIGSVYETATSSNTQNVSFTDTALGLTFNKTGSSDRASVFGGAIANISTGTYVKDRRTVSFDNVTVDVNVTGHARDRKFGAILGAQWYAADVTMNGVTMDASITATGSAADYAGLVRSATGHWDVQDISFGTVNYNVPSGGSTFGVGVNKAYLVDGEVEGALYMDVNDAGYDIGSLTFTGSPSFSVFDEVCADSRFNGTDITTNGQSIISITNDSGSLINTSGTVNVYQNKTAYGKTAAGAINAYTRYYYNMAYARTHTETPKYKFLTWSAKAYAHNSLDAWFATDDTTFTGDLDMTGLSYYPVDLNEGVTFSSATLKLDNNLMETWVNPETAGTRSTRANDNQHYLMHTAVFRNDPTASINISGLTIQGNVPKLSDGFCGFLVAGTLGGAEKDKVTFNGSNLVFDGAYITNAGAYFTDTTYAPLLINNIGKNTDLTIAGAAQSTSAYSSLVPNFAASSLIGDVGETTARAIYLTFTGLKFDGRSSASSIGNLDTAYGTTKSIFSRATILNSFKYTSESSGTYNYMVDEDWTSSANPAHNVTYGREITSPAAEFYDLQSRYLSSEYYTNPTTNHAGSAYDFSSGWLPHVYVPYNLALYQHELSVNVAFVSEIEGCGKYGDPYVIDDDEKLGIISKIIRGDDVGSDVKIYFPNDMSSAVDSNENDANAAIYAKTNYTKYQYAFGTTNFTRVTGSGTVSNTNARRWLAGAYYVVTRDITLSGGVSTEYVSLGEVSDAQYAFRGVIVGRGNPVITNNSRQPLIYTSLGCVIKDLTVKVDVDYNGTSDITIAAPQGNGTYALSGGNNAYGAVIRQILGGDNIIDNVNVTFTSATFNITSAGSSYYPRLVPVGGYVGVIVNGGLVFRNMPASYKGLTASTFSAVNDAGYLYVNPIIGRVIAGYAFHEASTASAVSATMDNGSKNYTLADVSRSGGKITVTDSSSQFTISVPDGQSLFLLSAAINSGACSAATGGNLTGDIKTYQDLSDFWAGFRAYTASRAGATYDDVGTASGDDFELAKKDKVVNSLARVPYILRAYTADDNSRLYMRSLARRTNNILQITGDCDISAGFRGIGSHYLNNDYLRLRVARVTGGTTASPVTKTLTFHMDVRSYETNNVSKYICLTEKNGDYTFPTTGGLGLFNNLKMTGVTKDGDNYVQNLELSGSIFYDVYTIGGEKSQYNYGTGSKQVSLDTYCSVGGIAGIATTGSFGIKDVTFNDFRVEGAKNAGGLVGYACMRNIGTSSFIKYTDGVSSAGSVTVIGGHTAGGLIGRVYECRVEIYGADGGTDIVVKDISLKAQSLNDTGSVISGNWINNLTTGAGGVIGSNFPYHKGNSGNEQDVLRNGETSTISSKRTYIYDINVVAGSTPATIRVQNDTSNVSDINVAGGFIGTTQNTVLKIIRCKLQNVNVKANIAGGIIGFSTQKVAMHLQDILVDGTDKSHAIQGNAVAGGVFGRFRARDGVASDINGVTVTNYTIESLSTVNNAVCAAGGILGEANGDNKPKTDTSMKPFEFRNAAVSNCIIKTNYTDGSNFCGTGGLIGSATPGSTKDKEANYLSYTNTVKIAGYNILLDNLELIHLAGGDTDQSTASTNSKIGDIIGNNSASAEIKLVGVTTSNMDYIGKHAGYYNSTSDNYGDGGTGFGTGFAVFADFRGNTTDNQDGFANIEDGSTAEDDYTNVEYASPYVTSNPLLTLGTLKITGDGTAATVSDLPINLILDGTSGARYEHSKNAYYTDSSGETNVQVFSRYNDGSRFSTFSAEVAGYLGTDFPVLILDDINKDHATEMINSYLRLLTNTTYDYGIDIENVYDVKIYNVVYNAASNSYSVSAAGASLRRYDGKFFMRSTVFDSGKSQFSLIDVRYSDPVKTSDTAYHLYVPVFVKKVLSYEFRVGLLSGTTYLQDPYRDRFGELLIENVGMPVTSFFEYSFTRTAEEWATAINAGEVVDRVYDKKLLFIKANTNELLKDFPSSTKLVLVDPNSGGAAYYADFSAVSGNQLSLSSFTGFTQKKLSELMKLTVTEDPAGTLVECGDGETASVTVGGQGYRLADSIDGVDDSAKTKYTVSVGTTMVEDQKNGTYVRCTGGETATLTVNGQGYRAATDAELADNSVKKYTADVCSERYYLSIYTDASVNPDYFYHYTLQPQSAFDNNDYPSKLFNTTDDKRLAHLIMGKIFDHSDIAVTSSPKDPAKGDTMDSTNNEINVSLSATFGLSSDLDDTANGGVNIVNEISDIVTSDTVQVFQSFLIQLNRTEGGVMKKEILGDPTATGSFSIDRTINASADSSPSAYGDTDSVTGTVSAIHSKQDYVEFVTFDVSNMFTYTDGGSGPAPQYFEIVSNVKLTYDDSAIDTQFPGRGDEPPYNQDGVTVTGHSNIAFQQESTPYSKNTIEADDKADGSAAFRHNYHTARASEHAELELTPIGDKVGDFTPLGINSLNPPDNVERSAYVEETFSLLPELDVTLIQDRVRDYDHAKVTVTLTQKTDSGYVEPFTSDGSYAYGIDDFIKSLFWGNDLSTATAISVDAAGKAYAVTLPKAALDDRGGDIFFPLLNFTVKTGSDLENAHQFFANYKITVTVVLQESGRDINVSSAYNYVIYTNAKIIPYFYVPPVTP
ncbi:MAG: hypothetical protein IJU52_04315 [Clostridia bacterium]|nr:hypothetical protein [Clostridia bacterium]